MRASKGGRPEANPETIKRVEGALLAGVRPAEVLRMPWCDISQTKVYEISRRLKATRPS